MAGYRDWLGSFRLKLVIAKLFLARYLSKLGTRLGSLKSSSWLVKLASFLLFVQP
jgi:hypothetical protein